MKLKIHKDVKIRVPSSRIKELFEAITDDEADPAWSSGVNLVFTDSECLRQLNSQYRAKDKPTDVLSFNIDEGAEPHGTFGEIYISVDFARTQAAEYGAGLNEELLRLICHGLLHLFGYDHIVKSDAKVMFERQEHYLSRLMVTNHG